MQGPSSEFAATHTARPAAARTRVGPPAAGLGAPALALALALALATWALPAFAQSPDPASPTPGPVPGCAVLRASGNPQYPPYLWVDPQDERRLIGAVQSMALWLAKEIGVPIELHHIGPWGRVQAETRAGNLDLIAGAFFTLPRTGYMDYFHPPFQQTRSAVWVGAGSRLKLDRWSDLIGLRGVTVINNSFGEAFDTFARDKLAITQVASLEQSIQMLQRGRADYLIYEDRPAEAFLARMGASDVRELGPPVATEGLHLTLSHKSACNTPELRGRLARALYKLDRERLMAGFVRDAVERWRGN